MRSRSRQSKFAWIIGATVTVVALLYWEQSALLFVLSTLATCGLLLVVAFSNLEARDKELHRSAAEKPVTTDEANSSDSAAHKRAA